MKNKVLLFLTLITMLGAQPVQANNLLVTVANCLKTGAACVVAWIGMRAAVQHHPYVTGAGAVAAWWITAAAFIRGGPLYHRVGYPLSQKFSLQNAVLQNSLWRAKLLLQTRMVSGLERTYALQAAVKKNRLDFVKLLMSHGVSLVGKTILYQAALHGNSEMVEFLLKNGTQSEINVPWGQTTYLEDSSRNFQAFCKLLQYDADPFVSPYGHIVESIVCHEQTPQEQQVAKLARLLFIVENNPAKDSLYRKAIRKIEDGVNRYKNALEDYNRELALLLINEEPDQDRIRLLNNSITEIEVLLQTDNEKLERLRELADPIMTPEKQSMVVEILTSLTEQEKEEYRKVLCVRYQKTHNLLIALILYNYFDEASALQMYCNNAFVQHKPLEAVRCSFTNNVLTAAFIKSHSSGNFDVKNMLEKTLWCSAIEE